MTIAAPPWTSLNQVAAPAAEPVSLVEMKAHLRVDLTDEDTLIQSLITAARINVEQYTRRQLVTATWRMQMRGFPCAESFEIPFPPLQSVSTISYKDTTGTSQTLSTDIYETIAAAEPGLVHLQYGQSWPSTQTHPAAVTVTFVAGYGAATTVPEDIKAAIKLLAANLFENREATIEGTLNVVPFAVTSLLMPHRVFKPN